MSGAINNRLRLTEALTMIEHEVVRARQKHPGSNPSKFHGLAVLQEEVAEMVLEVRHGTLAKARAEAIQVGAMAIRFLLEATEDQL